MLKAPSGPPDTNRGNFLKLVLQTMQKTIIVFVIWKFSLTLSMTNWGPQKATHRKLKAPQVPLAHRVGIFIVNAT